LWLRNQLADGSSVITARRSILSISLMPSRSASKLQAVAAAIERGGRFLLGKRSMHKVVAPGMWCPISGRIDPGESEEEAVAREVLEETGLHVRAVEKLCATDTRDGTTTIHWWRVKTLDDAPALLLAHEHTELRWVSAAEMADLEPTFPEDLEIVKGGAARRPL
jgi:8-oxo-dGTP pyrophosphatase MutT (NUDIX family)